MSQHAEIAFRPPQATSNFKAGTFLERGVVVPFTTPMLVGARVRPADRKTLELLVANPSGAGGVYVMSWSGVSTIGTPTLHDQVLYEQAQALKVIAPAAIRRLTLDAARRGLAGRAAAAAAVAATAAEEQLATLTRLELLRMLVEQVGGPAPQPRGAADIEQLGSRAVAGVAATLGRSRDKVSAMLDELAVVFAPLGIGGVGAHARVPAALAALEAMRSGIDAAMAAPPPMSSPDADLVTAAAGQVANYARTAMTDAIAPLSDLPALLRAWAQAPAKVAAKAARPDWLLDGWERIWTLWRDDPQRSEPLFSEMADLVPAIPREAAEWVPGCSHTAAGIMRSRRAAAGTETWRGGDALQERIVRNERLHARALAPA
jgi:hypothetical protein